MKKVGDLSLFQPIAAGTLAMFPAIRARNVRLSVNTPGNVALHVVPLTDDGEIDEDVVPMFLATADGLEEIEFYAHGPFAIQADGDFGLKTLDGQPVHVEFPDEATFTRIAERRPRNPEIERLQHMLMQNQERRMGGLYEEIRLEREALARERERIEAEHSRAGADGGNSPPSEPPVDGGAPDKGAGKTGVGTEGGNSAT